MSRKQWMLTFGIAGTLALAAPAIAAAQGRFHGLDTNRDGVITRAEWRGNDTSFRQHDRDRDGVIRGKEVSNVPAWDSRNKRWERSVGTAGKAPKAKDPKVKTKPSTPAKTKPAKPPKGGRGRGGN